MNQSRQRQAARVPGIESMPLGWESTPAGRAAMTAAAKAELREMRWAAADRASKPPEAALDGYEFAASWPAFMKAIGTEKGAAAVHAAIRNAGLTERIPSGGGFLLPWKLAESVFAYLSEAVVWPRATVLEMGEYRLALPLLDNPSQSGGQQGLGGVTFSIVADGKPIPASNPQFGVTALDARKLAALITPVPNELADDAAAAFSDLFSRIMGMGLAWETDDLFFTGNGVNEPEGLLNCPAAVKVTRNPPSGFNVGHLDVVTMLKQLHPASKKRATWLASEDVFDQLLELYEIAGTAPSGQMIPPPQTLKFNSMTGTWELLGVELEVTDHQPPAGTPGDLVLCDLSLYMIGSREMMTVERAQKGATFTADASAYRVRTRIDGRYIVQEPYTLANGKVVSPLVTLQ